MSSIPSVKQEILNLIEQLPENKMPESYPIVYRDVRRSVVRRFPYVVIGLYRVG